MTGCVPPVRRRPSLEADPVAMEDFVSRHGQPVELILNPDQIRREGGWIA